MRVAILGAGAIAYGNAAVLCRDGHAVTLWSPSGQRTAPLASGGPLVAAGAVEGEFHPRVATSCADALVDAEAVIVAVPGYAYRPVLDAAAPNLRSDQVVVFSAHLSLAALYLARLLRVRGVTTPIAAPGHNRHDGSPDHTRRRHRWRHSRSGGCGGSAGIRRWPGT